MTLENNRKSKEQWKPHEFYEENKVQYLEVWSSTKVFFWRKVQVRFNVRRSCSDRLLGAAVPATPFAGIVQDQPLVRLPRKLFRVCLKKKKKIGGEDPRHLLNRPFSPLHAFNNL
ncbi:hypothetical protein TNCV_1812631 [Trichonephila clavipes]|uniref:Uncharacterized protein n=1 Tax=Trichonephila clavipes TaxID=2585209 RepID=A0A8X6W7H1_TRICX|nr:hypothetical protein TNCV_1812631 [Trichonephila clavipes]